MGRRMAQRDDRVGRWQGLNDPIEVVYNFLCKGVPLILSVIVNCRVAIMACLPLCIHIITFCYESYFYLS